MPTTRGGSVRSKTTGESSTSSDWSMNTPSDSTSTSATSTLSRSTLTKRTPPPSVRSHRSPVLQPDTVGEESTQGKDAQSDPLTSATSKQKEATETARQEEDSSTPQGENQNIAVVARRNIRSTPTSREESLQQPHRSAKPTRDVDAQSDRSLRKKRAEAQAKMTLALRNLEVAEARSRLAQAELDLIAADSEEEDGAGQEIYEQTREVEKWIIHTAAGTAPDKERIPAETEEKKSDIQELAQVILKLADKSRDLTTPKHLELPHFNGACEEWLAFKRSYEDMADSFNNTQNLARLRRAIQGKAREAVHSLLFTAEDPREVIKGLEARFGRPGALALAELEKLKNLPKVNENPSEICVFASKVKNAVATIKALKKPQYLSSPETMKVITDKMPPSMKFRWFSYHRSRRNEDLQELALIEEFLEIEADMCGDFAPLDATVEQKKTIRKSVHAVQQESEEKQKTCPNCQEEHHLSDCKAFKEANINEKWEIVKRAKICFKCLRFRHSRINCRAPVCKKCKRWHHTILHSDKPPVPVEKKVNLEENPSEKVASIHKSKGEEKAYLKIVPVDLYGPKGQARVLALLDEGSTVTLLDASIAEQIGAEGRQENLTIETVGGKIVTKSGSQKIELKIKGAHRRDKKTIAARTIDDLRLNDSSVLNEVEDMNKEDCVELTKEEKTLGLRWLVKEDALAFNVGLRKTPKDLLEGKRIPTKREVTSAVMSTFDPMGFATPVLIQGKKLIQNIWRTKIDWDDEINENQNEAWRQYLAEKTYWTDSSTVLQWIKSEPRKFKTFVANRLAEIEEKSRPDDWRWVPTKENPADDATRGTPLEFDYNSRWFQGPKFLREPEEEWPFRNFKQGGTMPEEKNKQKVMATKVEEENLIDLERFSGWKRLLRTTARVVAFACLLLKKTHRATNVAVRRKEDSWRPQKKTQKPTQVAVTPRQEKKRLYVPLEKEHLKKAELLLIRQSQNDSFASEIRNLKAGKPRLDNSSRLKRIDVYIDDDGIIKLRSRTMKFRGEERRKMNPIILDAAVLNERTPPEEVLHTLMTEVEHIVNSRPLTPVSMDPDDEESLTPNHFLLGRSCGAMTPGEFSETDLIGKANWRTSQRLADHF
ncbi:hypothetical protein HF086_007330 [Spodoptera exigua]|uniref:Peptidase A2 domain-containing protein n=1 Tax=Spodoptera exigua TaxID=7107 RepID=A0A922SKP5_SPOEX|nr:hypothetical protein HF086_007330 [Spodoptera exigua]